VERDCLSAKKYWHFIKVMGRSASHIALEVALKCQTQRLPVSEEVAENKWTLAEVTETIARVVDDRSAQKKNYGVVVVPRDCWSSSPR
jgi:pyrophosphate--fructose-6-phosphate 1-phosphotransferase